MTLREQFETRAFRWSKASHILGAQIQLFLLETFEQLINQQQLEAEPMNQFVLSSSCEAR